MERGREEQGLMEGGVWWGADGGQGVLGLEDVAVRAWRATSSVGILRWRPIVIACRLRIACCLLLMCCLLFACCLPNACCLLFACRFLVACCLACHLSSHVACFHVSLLLHIVSGWWCWAFAAARGAGPSSSSMGWPTHHSPASTRCMWCGCSSHLLSGVHRRPGAANKVSEGGGGDDDGVAAHIPQHPHHIHGVGTLLVCYPACTVVLGLQKKLVRWGAMTTGGHSPSPALPRMWHGHSACSLTCLHLHPLH